MVGDRPRVLSPLRELTESAGLLTGDLSLAKAWVERDVGEQMKRGREVRCESADRDPGLIHRRGRLERSPEPRRFVSDLRRTSTRGALIQHCDGEVPNSRPFYWARVVPRPHGKVGGDDRETGSFIIYDCEPV